MSTATQQIDWAAVGKAERQLISDVIDFENEATRIECTTYMDKNPHYLEAAWRLREAIKRYGESLRAAGINPR